MKIYIFSSPSLFVYLLLLFFFAKFQPFEHDHSYTINSTNKQQKQQTSKLTNNRFYDKQKDLIKPELDEKNMVMMIIIIIVGPGININRREKMSTIMMMGFGKEFCVWERERNQRLPEFFRIIFHFFLFQHWWCFCSKINTDNHQVDFDFFFTNLCVFICQQNRQSSQIENENCPTHGERNAEFSSSVKFLI